MLSGGAFPAACCLGTAISAPLLLPSPAAAPATYVAALLRAEVAVSDGACRLSIGSTTHVSTTIARVHGAGGTVSLQGATFGAAEQLVASCSEPLAVEYAYRQLAAAGLQYGPSFRLLRNIKRSGNAAAAQVQQPDRQLPNEFIMNPAVLDSCLQLGGIVPTQLKAVESTASATYIPASLASLHISSMAGSKPATAMARRSSRAPDTAAVVSRDLAIIGPTGAMLCQLEHLESRSTSSNSRAVDAVGNSTTSGIQQDMLYEICWSAADPASGAPQLVDSNSGSSLMSLHVSTRRSHVQLAATGIATVQAALGSSSAAMKLQTHGVHVPHAAPAVAVGTKQAGQLWGLLRTAAAECQTLAVSGQDGDSLTPFAFARASMSEFNLSTQQTSSAFDGYGSTLSAGLSYSPCMLPSTARSVPTPFQLFPQPRGALQNLAALPLDATTALAPGQVLIAVKAVGINFR